MYKAIVVDDEPYMLEAWETLIDWQAFGYQLCGTAKDGEEALALIKTNEPDLVMTDIQMPVLDGIELIRVMKEELRLEARTVIVSGYSEFTYAQQALRYQVDHYVLKPLMLKEIHSILTELKEELDKALLAKEEVKRERAAVEAATILRLAKCGGAAAVAAAERMLEVEGDSQVTLLLAESADQTNRSGDSQSEAETLSIAVQLQQYVSHIFHDDSIRMWLFEDGPERAGLLVVNEQLEQEKWETALSLVAAAQPVLLEELTVYSSASSCKLSELHELYSQMLESRRNTQFFVKSGLLVCRKHEHDNCKLVDITSIAQELLNHIEAGDADRIQSTVDRMHASYEGTPFTYGWLQGALEYLCGELLRRSEEEKDESGWLLNWCKETTGTKYWTSERLKAKCMEVSVHVRHRNEPARAVERIIAEAITYLKNHYQEKMQILDVADLFHLNPVYFGQQFKRTTGTSFHDFIHNLRIDEAKKLIRRTDLRLSDIARMLGYHSTEYFTVKFKALTGKLPSAYKNACQR